MRKFTFDEFRITFRIYVIHKITLIECTSNKSLLKGFTITFIMIWHHLYVIRLNKFMIK